MNVNVRYNIHGHALLDKPQVGLVLLLRAVDNHPGATVQYSTKLNIAPH